MTIQVPSDSYVTLAEADAYHAMRPTADKWGKHSDEAKEKLLVAASDYLDDNYPLKGGLNALLREGKADIPQQVKRAVCELAVIPQLTRGRSRLKESVKVSSIAVTWGDGDDYANAFAGIKGMLGDLIGGTKGFVPMLRG